MAVTVSEMAQRWREREAERRARAEKRASRLGAHLAEARRILHDRGAVEVWLFGSLATAHVHPGSDVDLAVLGLPATSYFTALADLMALFGTPVDLVRIEEAPTSLRERIAREGRLL